ncbi:MAG: hypothetical protein JRD89_05050 [Deltaproteobacteria bacterium]|nr:hypothetical protein [Deltaproteobacteria bacterium]
MDAITAIAFVYAAVATAAAWLIRRVSMSELQTIIEELERVRSETSERGSDIRIDEALELLDAIIDALKTKEKRA